jgi:hypothetical protein
MESQSVMSQYETRASASITYVVNPAAGFDILQHYRRMWLETPQAILPTLSKLQDSLSRAKSRTTPKPSQWLSNSAMTVTRREKLLKAPSSAQSLLM